MTAMHPVSYGDNYFLGLPAWAFAGWKDRYFSDEPSRLASYAEVFNTVEGNTTFYRSPDPPTLQRWHDAVEGTTFRFCFKLPREVTHEFSPDLGALAGFLDSIEPLRENLGPLLVQFPAAIGPGELATFEPVFSSLSGRFSFVIEVRHPDFFSRTEYLQPTLERYSAGRVVLDSRPLFEGDRTHPEVLAALHKKPDLPVRPSASNGVAFVRLILHPDVAFNRPYIDEWADRTAAFIEQGVTTFMMIHCPNNLHCPPLAQSFHRALMARSPGARLADLPPWPLPQQHGLPGL